MNPRNLTREAIEQSNDMEPYCFETDREEQWFNVGLQYGLDVADSDPISPWISVKDELHCNHKELIDKNFKGNFIKTLFVVVWYDNHEDLDCMISENGEWRWLSKFRNSYTHWFPIPKLPKNR